jgi:putative flippase GtrA
MSNKARALLDRIKAVLSDRNRMKEITLYILFGVATTAVNWGVYVALTAAFGLSGLSVGSWQHKLVSNGSNITAWILGVLFAYFTNRKFVFRSDPGTSEGRWKEFFLFVSARIMSYVLFDFTLFNFSVYYLGIGDKVTKLLMNALVVIFNYFASKNVVFKKRGGQ